MRCDFCKMGAGMLASCPLFMQLGGSKLTWWIGVVFGVLGPVLMSLKKGK